MFRILHFSTPMGSKETIVITQDMDVDADDFCPPGQTLDHDLHCETTMGGDVDGLPLDWELYRR